MNTMPARSDILSDFLEARILGVIQQDSMNRYEAGFSSVENIATIRVVEKPSTVPGYDLQFVDLLYSPSISEEEKRRR